MQNANIISGFLKCAEPTFLLVIWLWDQINNCCCHRVKDRPNVRLKMLDLSNALVAGWSKSLQPHSKRWWRALNQKSGGCS